MKASKPISCAVLTAYLVVEGGNIILDPGDTKRDTLPAATVIASTTTDTGWEILDTVTDVRIGDVREALRAFNQIKKISWLGD